MASIYKAYTKPNRDSDRQSPKAPEISHGRPPCVHRVRRFHLAHYRLNVRPAEAPRPLDRPALHNPPLTPPYSKPDSPPLTAPLTTSPGPKHDSSSYPTLLPTLPRPKPNSPPHMAPLHHARLDVEAAAANLSETLLSYGHRDWEKVQRDASKCNNARPYLQLSFPKHLPPSLCDHITSHKRSDPADILDLSTKGRLIHRDDDTLLW